MSHPNTYDPFFNVRKGGPKEKRIRRVELMGEHKPKPIYYVKVSQSKSEELLTEDNLRDEFSQFGEIADLYRPLGNSKEPKEFAFVGYYNSTEVHLAISAYQLNPVVEGKDIQVEEAKQWNLDLYPKSL